MVSHFAEDVGHPETNLIPEKTGLKGFMN
jgi:hypothetical protein